MHRRGVGKEEEVKVKVGNTFVVFFFVRYWVRTVGFSVTLVCLLLTLFACGCCFLLGLFRCFALFLLGPFLEKASV